MFGKNGLLGLGSSNCRIDLTFKSNEKQPLQTATIRVRGDDPNATEQLPLYKPQDTVKGEVRLKQALLCTPVGESVSITWTQIRTSRNQCPIDRAD